MLIGFHQTRVTELESELERLRAKRLSLIQGADGLKNAMNKMSVTSIEEVDSKILSLKEALNLVEREKVDVRKNNQGKAQHSTDLLRANARELIHQINAISQSIDEVDNVVRDQDVLRNDLIALSIKSNRVVAARAVLGDLNFTDCPRCAQRLPNREIEHCNVCNQPEIINPDTERSFVLKQDLQSRISELEDSIQLRKRQSQKMGKELASLIEKKGEVDENISAALSNYDSSLMSNLLELEGRSSKIREQINGFEKLKVFFVEVDAMYKSADEIAAKESTARRELQDERAKAERDTKNLRDLEDLFLDCLVRSKLPGIEKHDHVNIEAPGFLPRVYKSIEDVTVISFSNYGSGGKKTIFKACFALAIHRLSIKNDGILPNLLIIDTPMKNISERENREQFEGFYNLLYELASTELKEMQFILIDKEFWPLTASTQGARPPRVKC